MTQVVFQRELLIDAPLTHVWQLVATEEGLRQWWGNSISLEAKEGGRCEEWRPLRNASSYWRGVVTLYTPPHQLVLTMHAQEPSAEGPTLTTISIALEPKGEQTRVHVLQRAFGASSAVGSSDPREVATYPGKPQGLPMAQLDQPAPGMLPTLPQLPTPGRIDPAQLLLTHQQSDALTLTWQRRLTSLTAAAQTSTQP